MRIRRIPLISTVGLATVVVAGVTDVAVGQTAQQRIVRAVTCRLHPTGPVTAELTDTLAGVQVLTGNLGVVRITADGVHRAGMDMRVQAVLHHVTTRGATTGGTATATIPYRALQQRMGGTAAGMTVGTDGTGLILTGTAGRTGLPVTVTTTISTTAHSLTITPTNLVLFGRATPVGSLASMPGASGLAGSLKPRTVHLPDLPARARLTAARPDSAGLTLELAIPHSAGPARATGAAAGSHCSGTKA